MNTEILAIIDVSGSMASIADDAIGGYNTFLKDQQAVEGEARMTLALFDHEYQLLYAGRAIAEAEPLTTQTYYPRGSTALLDAIGRTLNEQGARIAAEGWAEKVIVTILTDGQENQSKEFNAAVIKEMVTAAEAKGWSFVFLAANQDAFATAQFYGISAAHTQNFASSSEGTTKAYASMSNTTRSLRTTTAAVATEQPVVTAGPAVPPKKAAKNRKGA
jgi:Mg-chelatase subunit ChlD